MNHWKSFAAILMILVLGVGACANPGNESDSSAPMGINTGNLARDFTLKSLDGGEVSLSDFRGDVVLVNFWATWCAPCRDEIPAFLEVYEAHKDEGFVILGLNEQESLQEIEPFVKEVGMTYPVLLDEQGQVMTEYRVIGLPTSMLVDREGVIRVRHTGTLTADQLRSHLNKILPAE